jgi:hypothetical protein
MSTSGITSGAHTHTVCLVDQDLEISTQQPGSRQKFSDARYTVTLPNKHALTFNFVGREPTLLSPPGSRSFSSLRVTALPEHVIVSKQPRVEKRAVRAFVH